MPVFGGSGEVERRLDELVEEILSELPSGPRTVEDIDEACDEVLQGLQAELSQSTKAIEFRVVQRGQEGTIWRLTVEARGDTGGGLDESFEGSRAWWPDPRRGGADVFSVIPEEEQINLRFATGSPPTAGQKLFIYPPNYLGALEKCWSDRPWARRCLNWLQGIQRGNEFNRHGMLKPGPFSKSLRERQRQAFRLPGWDAGFLWGPPGTGKTYTVGRLLARYLTAFPSSKVLLLSTTNSAVDDALVSVDKALEELSRSDGGAEAARRECARVGSRFIAGKYTGRSHLLRVRDESLVRRLTELEATEPDRMQAGEYAAWQDEVGRVLAGIRRQAKEALSGAKLAAMTTTRAVFSFADLRRASPYDLIVFDEASQVGLAHALALVPLGRKVLFAGDPRQLAPIVKSRDPLALRWLGESIFSQMKEGEGSTCMLDEQSRMAEPICGVVSDVFYGGKLGVAKDCLADPEWGRGRALACVAPMGTQPVHLEWIRADGQWSGTYGGPIRRESAERVLDMVRQLTAAGLDPSSILVLVPFRAQRSLIRSLLRKAGLTRVRVSTVHRSAGSECHTVIFDPVAGTSPFLGREPGRRLLNVALSRAQGRLVVLLSERDRGNSLLDQVATAIEKARAEKVAWSGRLAAVQPRIRLLRSFDQRHHSYQGYVLRIEGRCGDETGEFLIAVGKGAHEKHRFRHGLELSGLSVPVTDPRLEAAGFYQTSRIEVEKEVEGGPPAGPPFLGVPPDLETYRSRGHRRLDARTYAAKCTTCIWGCRMPVEMIVDHWNPERKQHRFETFCYGPKSCPLYRAGPTRKVPGRKGMSWEEEDWVDEDATSHRGPDD